jgi:hypothetical protein
MSKIKKEELVSWIKHICELDKQLPSITPTAVGPGVVGKGGNWYP